MWARPAYGPVANESVSPTLVLAVIQLANDDFQCIEGLSEIEVVTMSSMYEIDLFSHEGRGGEGKRWRGRKGNREEGMQRWR